MPPRPGSGGRSGGVEVEAHGRRTPDSVRGACGSCRPASGRAASCRVVIRPGARLCSPETRQAVRTRIAGVSAKGKAGESQGAKPRQTGWLPEGGDAGREPVV